jgi:hypothetical protein
MKFTMLALILTGSAVFAGPGVTAGVAPAVDYQPLPSAIVTDAAVVVRHPGMVWIPGYFGPRRAWHGGYWARPPFRGARWVPPRWSRGRYRPGHWR